MFFKKSKNAGLADLSMFSCFCAHFNTLCCAMIVLCPVEPSLSPGCSNTDHFSLLFQKCNHAVFLLNLLYKNYILKLDHLLVSFHNAFSCSRVGVKDILDNLFSVNFHHVILGVEFSTCDVMMMLRKRDIQSILSFGYLLKL